MTSAVDKSTAVWTPVRIRPWVRNGWRIPEEADELSWAAGLTGMIIRHSDRDPSVKVRLYRDMVEVPERHASTIWFSFDEVEALEEWSDEYWAVIRSREAWDEEARREFDTSLRGVSKVGQAQDPTLVYTVETLDTTYEYYRASSGATMVVATDNKGRVHYVVTTDNKGRAHYA